MCCSSIWQTIIICVNETNITKNATKEDSPSNRVGYKLTSCIIFLFYKKIEKLQTLQSVQDQQNMPTVFQLLIAPLPMISKYSIRKETSTITDKIENLETKGLFGNIFVLQILKTENKNTLGFTIFIFKEIATVCQI